MQHHSEAALEAIALWHALNQSINGHLWICSLMHLAKGIPLKELQVDVLGEHFIPMWKA